MKFWHRVDLVDDYRQQFLSILLGNSINKNIVKVNLKQNNNLYCMIIWSTYVQREHILDKPAR